LSLSLAHGDSGPQIECHCGHVFAEADHNWKDGAASVRLEGTALPRGIVVHRSLELMQYLCPSCGRQHSIEVRERGAAALADIRLTGTAP
jgi:acetone carboxylase gamma subunit